MIGFALLVLHSVRGRAALYLLFGAAALAVSGDPFFLVFIVPGTLVALASR